MQKKIKRGEIYLVNLGNGIGSIQGFTRPMIIVANSMCCKYSPVIHAVPTTGKLKRWMPTHVEVGASTTGLLRDSIALCEQLQLLPREAFAEKIGCCDSYIMDKISDGLRIQFDLVETKNNIAYAN